MQIPTFRKLFKDVIADLEKIENLPVNELEDKVIECFDKYSYEGEDEVVGFDKWPNLVDGEYELNCKIDHEDAYELTLFVKIDNGLVTVKNVL